jgi:hypothetical protein
MSAGKEQALFPIEMKCYPSECNALFYNVTDLSKYGSRIVYNV